MSNMLLEKSREISSRRNEEAEPKQKQCLSEDVSGGESGVLCCKESAMWYMSAVSKMTE